MAFAAFTPGLTRTPLRDAITAATRRAEPEVLPALLVLVGGFTLRWVMVRAGQLSHIVQASVN